MKLSPRRLPFCLALCLTGAAWGETNHQLAPGARAQEQTKETGAPSSPQMAPTPRLVATLADYEGPSTFRGRPALVAFSPDGKLLAISGPERVVKIFDAATGKLAYILSTTQKWGINAFSFAPDSRTAVTRDAQDKTIRLWDLSSGKELRALTGRKRNLETKSKAAGIPGDEFTTVPLSPDGATVLAEKEDDLVTAFDAATGQEKVVLDHKTESSTAKAVLKMAFGSKYYELHMQPVYSPDGRLVVTVNGDKFPKLWDAATGKLIATLEGHKDRVYNAAFSPDGRLFVTETVKGTTMLRDAATGQLKATLKSEEIDYSYFALVPLYSTPSFAFSPDSQTLVTFRNRSTQLWDATTGALKQTLKKAESESVVFSPDSRTLITCGGSGAAAKLWDVPTAKLLRELPKPLKETHYVALSPDARVLLTASDAGIRLWDFANGELLATLDKARFPARFSPDGRLLATGGTDKTAMIYELPAR
ncbi:MAG: WD40 repeat domain-containing protein [Acidobacteria bacterium]|nr:WD40 repeat domain-containing protein [Acidobacteriota bacterium]